MSRRSLQMSRRSGQTSRHKAAMSPVAGFHAPFGPPLYRCHLCGKPNAGRGFPNDLWFCTPCVPPALRFPWEAGAVAEPTPGAHASAPSRLRRPSTDAAAPLPGLTPA